ncbi:hypothetical protein M1146_08060 [Patescibacteria group bacterium]|nr:hypothetical protein [Patescibacteria group bacterium]
MAERVVQVEDGEKLQLGDSELEFIHTRGHARHHMVIYDKNTKSIFTGKITHLCHSSIPHFTSVPSIDFLFVGDAFGVSYLPLIEELGANKGVLFPSSSPIDFEPIEAHKSVDKIISTGAERAYPTHFGVWEDMTRGAELLHDGISRFEGILQETKSRILEGTNEEDLQKWAEEKQKAFFDELLVGDGIDTEKHKEALWDIIRVDVELNAAGIIIAAKRELRSKKENE